MQPRQLLISLLLAFLAVGQTTYITATVAPVPQSTARPSCTQQACATYTNECGEPYGGCFSACPGHTIPTFTPPPCATSTTVPTSSSSSSRCPTVCWNLINSCSMWYGGCHPMCGPYSMPSFTPPPCPSTISLIDPPASITSLSQQRLTSNSNNTTTPITRCSRTVCWDHQNECGLKYGGCHADCEGYPTPSYIDPGCPSNRTSNKSFITQTPQCGMYCPVYVDGCGNTFGPGCYASCPGSPPPSFETPYCETSVVTTLTAVTTGF